MQAVRFDHYGGVDVLEVRDVDDPKPDHGEVLVEVKAAGINPGEIAIREGYLHERWPATFPSGEGTRFRRDRAHRRRRRPPRLRR